LIRHPTMLRCTVVVSIQNLTAWPVLLAPSQNCCGPTVMFPDGGTTRSISIASGRSGLDNVKPPAPLARECRKPVVQARAVARR
jgi:hypothetical protein